MWQTRQFFAQSDFLERKKYQKIQRERERERGGGKKKKKKKKD